MCGECLYVPAYQLLATDGASSLYDGTPLVKRSVDRVRTPSHRHMSFTLLMMDVAHRERQSCSCPSTTALDLSAFL